MKVKYLSQVLIRNVHDFLWRAGTLDGGVGEREKRRSWPKVLQSLVSFVHVEWRIIGTNSRIIGEGVFQTLDLHVP